MPSAGLGLEPGRSRGGAGQPRGSRRLGWLTRKRPLGPPREWRAGVQRAGRSRVGSQLPASGGPARTGDHPSAAWRLLRGHRAFLLPTSALKQVPHGGGRAPPGRPLWRKATGQLPIRFVLSAGPYPECTGGELCFLVAETPAVFIPGFPPGLGVPPSPGQRLKREKEVRIQLLILSPQGKSLI